MTRTIITAETTPAQYEPRPFACPVCEGDGGFEGRPSRWSLDGSGDWHRCTFCDGDGWIEESPEIRTLDDICAFYDGTEESGNYGWGETREAAISDLLENYEDEQ